MSEIVYGRNAVMELMKTRPDEIEKVYFQFNTSDKKITELLLTAKRNGLSIGKANGQRLSEIAQSANHQGVCAIVGQLKYFDLEDLLEAPRGEKFFFLILDSLEDPQNVGAIIRTAEAAGVDAVIIPKDNFAPINATVHKTSAGALSHIRLCRVVNLAQTFEALKKKNIWIISTDTDAGKSYTNFDYTMNCAIVIGSEGSGVRRLLKERCDELVQIPILGKSESLNASVAAGVMLYEVVRQRSLSKV
ncbi:MAG: 23S rRNA (guanosine(2251)-2'-O)-methyltransferase RlmB [Rhizobacter sp.]|nr:23S rRNA (guanosine(2251)-2'-O)-methyltransferase RlmB [Chlorobiales bacterium]